MGRIFLKKFVKLAKKSLEKILKNAYLTFEEFLTILMSQSIPTGYIPGQPPWISSKNLPGGRDLTFESCPGAGNSTRTEILWKMKVKLQKIAWIKFLQVKTKNKLNF